MQNQDKYKKLASGWDKYVESLAEKFAKDNYIDSSKSKTQIKDDIYDRLTKDKFDTKAVDFMFESAKLDNPKLKKEDFIKQLTNTPIKQTINGKSKTTNMNLLDNIDNEATQKRITNRIDKEVGVLQQRVDRLDTYGINVNMDNVKASLSDIKRMIGTLITRDNNYNMEH
jgi:hypothetical protein